MNQTTRLAIDWTHGHPRSGADEDADRAIDAAIAVFEAHDIFDLRQCQIAYQNILEGIHEDSAIVQQLASIWTFANRAADTALTAGWDKPEGASCELRLC